jgi:outer membrane protein OmpA-like peptidoglycan-associated protein
LSKLILLIGLMVASTATLSQPLKSPTSNEILMKLRESPTRSMLGGSDRNIGVQKASVELLIQFEFDSAELSSQGQLDLEQLAIALNSPDQKNSSYLIEGHTDQVGSSQYNMDLSLKRAQSVIRALVRFGISSQRLTPLGYGATRLYNPAQPEASENRRVRVVMK